MPVAGAQPIYFVPIAANGVPIMMATPPTEGNGGTMLAAAAPPVVGYDEMAATQIVKLIQSGALSTDQVLAISRYESMHQARKTVLQAAGVT
jgi:tetrahydromethanopterin S-methyltransferase subunit D